MPNPARNLFAFLALAATLAACEGDSAPQSQAQDADDVGMEPADLVLLGGTIATVDDDLGTVQALAVNDYRISAVGTDDEISARIGPDTEVIELEGRFVMPGFIEGHGHFMSLGRAKQILDLNDVDNWEQIVSMVATAVDKAQPGEWIFGRGWHQDKWDSVPEDAVEGVPVNDSLSEVSPDNPVVLGHASGHAAFFNDRALEVAGVTDDTPDPAGGTIVRGADGEATGLMRETAQRLINEALEAYEGQMTPEQTDALMRERVRLASDEALRNGVTSFQDAGSTLEMIDFFKELEEEGALDVRLYVMMRRATNEEMEAALPEYRMIAEGNDFLTVRSIKRQVDGALGAHGAWLLEPYADLPDTAGLVLEPLDDIERTAELAVQHGYQVNTHAIGDRANREILDLYERVWERMDVDGSELRWRMEHAQHIHPDDVPRFGQLGVIASIQAVHGTSDGPWIPTRLGEERAEATSQPWRDLFNTGAVVTNGTDVPVERISPIASYFASVSRMMNTGERFYPEHVMTREEALRTYTINNAYAAFEEDLKGSLSPGKYADMVVLSQDILHVEEQDIPRTEVEMTFVGGELKYARDMDVALLDN